jgi:D-alanyl-D-alanine carboxypeptidase (penicillin-binding protein 5/6)
MLKGFEHGFRTVVLVAALALASALPAGAQGFDTKAPHALLMDYDSGTVLFEKAADERVAPASMAKLMTAEYVFNESREAGFLLMTVSPCPSTLGALAERRPALPQCMRN